jgi:hypothetical protein
VKKSGLVVAACLIALAGCKGDAKKDAGAGKAQGEVLPGSASDAMLPLDTVKSQAPLAPKSEGGEGSDTKGKSKNTPDRSAIAAPTADVTSTIDSKPEE